MQCAAVDVQAALKPWDLSPIARFRGNKAMLCAILSQPGP